MKRIGACLLVTALSSATVHAAGWTELPALPDAREGATAGCQGAWLVAGGHDASGLDQAGTFVLRGDAGWQSAAGMSGTRWYAAAATLNGASYAIGGLSDLATHGAD